MKGRSKSISLQRVLTVALLTATICTLASIGQADAESTTLKMVSFLPKSVTGVHFAGVFADRVTKRSNGELVVKWVGGPEVMPPPAMGKAIMRGTIDLLAIAGGRISDLMPEANANHLSDYTPMEERKNGYYEWLAGHYKRRMNVHYLGRLQSNVGWVLGTTFPITKPGDLVGHQIGARELNVGGLKALGASPVVLDSNELFTGVERGLVTGYTLPFTNIIPWGLLPVTKTIVDHEFQSSTQVQLLANMKKWESLPEKHRALMQAVAIEIEPEVVAFFGEKAEKDREKLMAAGVKFVKFSPADAKAFLSAMNDSAWEEFRRGVSPEDYARARELLLK